MISNTILMEQLNQYYDAWLQYNNVYEEWAKAHGLSVNCLLVLCAICDSGDGCTQKINQPAVAHTQTDNQHGLQGFAAQRVRRTFPAAGG